MCAQASTRVAPAIALPGKSVRMSRLPAGILCLALLLALGVAAPASATERDVEAGPLWTDIHAQRSCPQVCQGAGAKSWTGQWHTTQMGRQSVCTCRFDGNPQPVRRPPVARPGFGVGTVQVEVLSASERWARDKCPSACQGKGLRWSGSVEGVPGWSTRWNCGCSR